MKLKAVQIQGYRAHEDTTVTLDNDLTVIVGRNNTGKTSFIEVIDKFIGPNKRNAIRTADFSADQRSELFAWLRSKSTKIKAKPPIPTITLTLRIDYTLQGDTAEDIASIAPYFTTLDTTCTTLEIECRYAPSNKEALKKALAETRPMRGSDKEDTILELIEKSGEYKTTYSAHSTFDDRKSERPNEAWALSREEVRAIVNTEYIYAQINLDDTSTDNSHHLSSAFERFYKEVAEDTELRQSLDDRIDDMQSTLSTAYTNFFEEALEKIQRFTSVTSAGSLTLKVESELNTSRMINSTTRVKYTDNASRQTYPESHNGLGYSRLTYTILQILAFKERWKHARRLTPINILFIEEPEAHLHPQMQEVFIRLVSNLLDTGSQLIVTTHSSHVLSERNLKSLRYFKRINTKVTCIDISKWADELKEADIKAYTTVSNYVQLRISDLFFADCAILVEGAAERLLLPKAIQTSAEKLRSVHYTIIEVGGTYARHIIPLLEEIKLPSIVITDIDSVEDKQHGKKAEPDPSAQQRSGNPTITHYVHKRSIKELLTLNTADKVHDGLVRICYQAEQDGYQISKNKRKYARTFEDALIYANADLFTSTDIQDHFEEPVMKEKLEGRLNAKGLAEKAYNIVVDERFKKTTFAIDCSLINDLAIPPYIKEGLRWLEEVLTTTPITDLD